MRRGESRTSTFRSCGRTTGEDPPMVWWCCSTEASDPWSIARQRLLEASVRPPGAPTAVVPATSSPLNNSSIDMSRAAQMEKNVATDGWALPVSSCEMNDADTSMSRANWRSEMPRAIRRARSRAPTKPGARRLLAASGCTSTSLDLRGPVAVALVDVNRPSSVATLLGTPIRKSHFLSMSTARLRRSR
jgi:hypothetical protein